MAAPAKAKTVQTFGRKRAAVAVALCKEGKGLIRLNGQPMHLIEPAILRVKAMEPILLLGRDKFAGIDIRVRVQGGGHSSQVYAVRQAIAKAVIAYAQKCESHLVATAGERRSGSVWCGASLATYPPLPSPATPCARAAGTERALSDCWRAAATVSGRASRQPAPRGQQQRSRGCLPHF